MLDEVCTGDSKGLLFGFGRMGITHIALLNRFSKKKLEWDIYDPSWKTRLVVRFFGNMAGLSIVSERDILKTDYDIAIICSPPQFHQSNYEMVKNSAKKIFLEKPGFVDVADINNLYVGYVLRHAPCILELLDKISNLKIKSVKIDIRSNTVTHDGSGWRASSHGGGVVNEFGSHAINMAKLITRKEYSITKYESEKVVSSSCPDICHMQGLTDDNVFVQIDLNWSDENVRKPTYKVIVTLEDDSEIHTDLYEIWTVTNDKKIVEVSGVAYWSSHCDYYLRGLEFSEQAKYFIDQSDFSRDLDDSSFTDKILRENT